MTLKFKRLWLLLTAVALLGACAVEEQLDELPVPDRGTTTFTVNLPAAQLVQTRSVGSEAENHIETLHLLVCKPKATGGDLLGVIDCTSSLPAAGTGTNGNRWTFKARLTPGTFDLLLVANAGGKVAALAAGTTRAAIEALLVEKATAWAIDGTTEAKSIPMFGQLPGVVVNATATSADEFSLRRMLARVNVANTATGDFTLTGVYLMNYRTKGYVIPNTAYPATGLVTGSDEDDLYFTATGNAVQNIYTFDAAHAAPYGTAGWQTNPCLIVKGSYKGHGDTYYRLDFIQKGAGQNPDRWLSVERNHNYQFTIVSVGGDGHGSIDEAYNARPFNMEADVTDWDDSEIGDIEFDGTHYFGISDREVVFTPMGNQGEVVTIKTNVPDFSLSLGGTKKLAADGTKTYAGPHFSYTLAQTGSDTYTLTIECPAPNVSPTQASRLESWTIQARRFSIPLTVDQDWTSQYISVIDGQSTRLYPEGTAGTPVPIHIVSMVPVTVGIEYTAGGSEGWLSGSTTVPNSGGVYAAELAFTVAPFRLGEGLDGTTDRSAVVTITPQGGEPTRYTITQEVPYIHFNQSRILVQRAPNATSSLSVEVITNLPKDDLMLTAEGFGGVGNRVTLANPLDPLYPADAQLRNLRFDVSIVQTAPLPTSNFGVLFSLAPKPGNKYGELAAGTVDVTIRNNRPAFGLYWKQSTVDNINWPFPANTSSDIPYFFPWNATSVDLEGKSNMGMTPDAGNDLRGGHLTEGTSTLDDAGDRLYRYQFTFNNTDYNTEKTYTLQFNGDDKSQSRNTSVSFTLGKQSWNIASGANQLTTLNWEGNSNIPLSVASNIYWEAYTDEDWLSFKTTDVFEESVYRNDHLTAPVEMPNSTTPVTEITGTLNVRVAPITELNPASLASRDYKRTGTISFWNHDDYGNGLDLSDRSITVTQYAPVLKPGSTTLPVSGNIAVGGGTFRITATTNLQGWGVKVYATRSDDGYSTYRTEIAHTLFGTAEPISAVAAAGTHAVDVVIHPFKGANARDLEFMLYCTGLSQEIAVATIKQDGTGKEGGENHVLYLQGSGANATLSIRRWETAQTAADIVDGISVTTLRTYLAFFKFGSVIGFSSEGAFTPSSIRFDPSRKTYTGTGTTTYNQITGVYNISSDYPVNISDRVNYHTEENLRAGKGDPCMLAGIDMSRIDEPGYLANYDSGWRMPTSEENEIFAGNPPRNTSNGSNWYFATPSPTNYYPWSSTNPGTGVFMRNPKASTNARLPAVGYRNETGVVSSPGTVGYYWSSTVIAPDSPSASVLYFGSSSMSASSNNIYFSMGLPVRCVRP